MSAALLKFQGANGSTAIVDETGRSWSAHGNAALSTASPTFGVSSLSLPDNTSYIDTSANLAALQPGAGDFGLQFWLKGVAAPFTVYDTGTGFIIAILNGIQFFVYDNQTSTEYDFFTNPYSIDMFNGLPLYICVERHNGKIGAYVNTRWLAANQVDDLTNHNVTFPLVTMARRQVDPSSRPGIGNINGFRMVVGSAIHNQADLASVPSPLDYSEVVPVTGSLAWTESNDSFVVNGAIGLAGALSWTEASDVFSMSGTISVPHVDVTGSIHWTEANDTWRINANLPQPENETITTRDFYAYLD